MSTTTSAAARTESEFNLLDLLKYLLSKWPWFVVSLAVCCTFAWYKGATAPLVYYSSAKVIIKDPSNKTSSAGLDRYDRSVSVLLIGEGHHQGPEQQDLLGGP